MTHDEAARVLKLHQEWRMGREPYDKAGCPMPHSPKGLTSALEYAIAVIERDLTETATQFDERVDEFRRSPHSAVFDAKDDALDIIDDLQRYIRKLEAKL